MKTKKIKKESEIENLKRRLFNLELVFQSHTHNNFGSALATSGMYKCPTCDLWLDNSITHIHTKEEAEKFCVPFPTNL